MIRYSCPTCGANLEAEDRCAGEEHACPSCEQLLRIPSPRSHPIRIQRPTPKPVSKVPPAARRAGVGRGVLHSSSRLIPWVCIVNTQALNPPHFSLFDGGRSADNFNGRSASSGRISRVIWADWPSLADSIILV